MDLAGRSVWQVAAGDNKRRYDDICLKYDIMMIGSGERGPFDEETYRDKKESTKKALRRFYCDVKPLDIVLLRLGSGKVLAVGEVAGDEALHEEEFGDIDGWRLQHVRQVRWVTGGHEFAQGTFGGRLSRVKKTEVLRWVHAFRFPVEARTRPLCDLPADTGELSDEELGALLVENGMSANRVARLQATMASLRPLVEWYGEDKKERPRRPSEHETITYLVVPLLFALGWSEKTVAIEWNNIDIALWDQVETEQIQPTYVIEVKSLGKSVFAPEGQAIGYAEDLDCERFFVTDGVRYACFGDGGGEYTPQSYLNITRLRNEYPVYDDKAGGRCGGAVDSLLSMAR